MEILTFTFWYESKANWILPVPSYQTRLWFLGISHKFLTLKLSRKTRGTQTGRSENKYSWYAHNEKFCSSYLLRQRRKTANNQKLKSSRLSLPNLLFIPNRNRLCNLPASMLNKTGYPSSFLLNIWG